MARVQVTLSETASSSLLTLDSFYDLDTPSLLDPNPTDEFFLVGFGILG